MKTTTILPSVALMFIQNSLQVHGFVPSLSMANRSTLLRAVSRDLSNPYVPASTPSTTLPRSTDGINDSTKSALVSNLKRELMQLSRDTDRGVDATASQVARARTLIDELARYNPTREPARPYYRDAIYESNNINAPSLAGTWTLVWTDAPDITSLKRNSLAQLGRIGQECAPPFIKNVIEWNPPSWTRGLPGSGWSSDTSEANKPRILQKVVTEATASPQQPNQVQLQVAGLEVVTDAPASTSSSWLDAVSQHAIPCNCKGRHDCPLVPSKSCIWTIPCAL
jgi:hypothetical protein